VWATEIDWKVTKVICINADDGEIRKTAKWSAATILKGDACNLLNISDFEFDIAFSNSVIEHVGNWDNMRAMANEIRRVAPCYIVQTPYFWFPIEPHAQTPFFHWIPQAWACRLLMMRSFGYWPRQFSITDAAQLISSTKLLDIKQMKELFDDALLIKERFLGLTKSLIAIRSLTQVQ
jgi:hypothetical protein